MKKIKSLFALIDCNNFFVSCEKLFRPDLEGKPVVVMSSNDGCVVSRSNEAKSIGIPMGAPVFKYKKLFDKHKVTKFSANFELYGDISKRIIELLSTMAPNMEVYSVDESFLDISKLHIDDYEKWGRTLHELILKYTGIPVSVGIASSKTLSKLASEKAKKDLNLQNVLYLYSENYDEYLSKTPIKDIWGVGRKLAPRLISEGLISALDLKKITNKRAQQLMGVNGMQMVAELNGVSCHKLELIDSKSKLISSTRTFGEDTNKLNSLESAIASFVTIATYRLRASEQLTNKASFFLTTNRNKSGYQSFSATVSFDTPTADTGLILSTLVRALAEIYKPNIQYHRAGVLLNGFVSSDYLQTDIFGNVDLVTNENEMHRMQAIDKINENFGKGTIKYAAEDLAKKWQPKRNLSSPHFTTNWKDIPKAKIIS